MLLLEPSIREVRQDDDFDQIRNLLLENKRSSIYFANTTDGIRNWFFPNITESQEQLRGPRPGYIAEIGSEIIAFMGLVPRERGKYGVIVYAMRKPDRQLLSHLLDKCENDMIDMGGKYLSCFAFTEFGQMRNREISLLEDLGFSTADEYMRVSARLLLSDWEFLEEEINTENIKAEINLELDDIYKILIEDGNVPNAVIFRHQFQAAEPGNVILTLRNTQQEITALAYSKVKKVNPNSDTLSAIAFNLHFRPQFELSRNDKKEFLQGVLYSMKQLDLYAINSLMSLKNVDTFTLMMREGFDKIHSNFFALTKQLGSGNEKV